MVAPGIFEVMTCKVMSCKVAHWLMVAPRRFEVMTFEVAQVMTCKVMTFEVAHWLMVAPRRFEVMTCKVRSCKVARWLQIKKARPYLAWPFSYFIDYFKKVYFHSYSQELNYLPGPKLKKRRLKNTFYIHSYFETLTV